MPYKGFKPLSRGNIYIKAYKLTSDKSSLCSRMNIFEVCRQQFTRSSNIVQSQSNSLGNHFKKTAKFAIVRAIRSKTDRAVYVETIARLSFGAFCGILRNYDAGQRS